MVKISHLSKAFENLSVLDDFSLALPGGITALLAPSGSGKTTLLRLIAGLEQPDSGEIHVSGPVSVLFQEDRLLPTLTALENVTLVTPDTDKAEELLVQLGLKDGLGLYPAQLSGGMQRRVALARALAYPAPVLLLDEPFKGLDEEQKKPIMELVKTWGESRCTLLITHSLQEAQTLAHRIYQADGPPLTLLEEA